MIRKVVIVVLMLGGGGAIGASDAHQRASGAEHSCCAISEIWIAAGTYRPDYDPIACVHTGDREATFQLANGVAVYGGFAGNEDPATYTLGDRDFVANETILSGDLNEDDGPDFVNNGENSYHVVTGSGTGETAVLDGFTITAGHAEGGAHAQGAGMYNDGGSPTLANCTFEGNWAFDNGGGLYSDAGSPSLVGCTFLANHVSSSNGSGGGMSVYRGSLKLSRCIFIKNYARDHGGGLKIGSVTATVDGCLFIGNSSDGYGGGGMHSASSSSSMRNCVFCGNATGGCGGTVRYTGTADSLLNNCTLFSNHADTDGGGIHNQSELTLINSILWGNSDQGGIDESAQIHLSGLGTVSVDYSCIEGWTGALGGIGNMSDDPVFQEGPRGVWTADATYDATIGQTAFTDAGAGWEDNVLAGRFLKPDMTQFLQAYIVNNTATQIFVWGDFSSFGTPVTAYQVNDYHLMNTSPCINAGDPTFVPATGETDIDEEDRVQQCRVDMGADETPYFTDCQPNGTADACDIRDGISLDDNGNGFPDECEPRLDSSDPPDGYIDPRGEDCWIDGITMIFDMVVRNLGGSPIDPDAFSTSCTGGECPEVTSVDASQNPAIAIQLTGPTEPKSWCTVTADVESELGIPGGGSVTFGRLPCDVNQSGCVTPSDANAFREAFFARDPEADMNCDGNITPTDANQYRWCFLGEQGCGPWNGVCMDPNP